MFLLACTKNLRSTSRPSCIVCPAACLLTEDSFQAEKQAMQTVIRLQLAHKLAGNDAFKNVSGEWLQWMVWVVSAKSMPRARLSKIDLRREATSLSSPEANWVDGLVVGFANAACTQEQQTHIRHLPRSPLRGSLACSKIQTTPRPPFRSALEALPLLGRSPAWIYVTLH